MSKPSFNLAACTAGHIRLPGGLIINYTLLIISGKNFHYVHSSPRSLRDYLQKNTRTGWLSRSSFFLHAPLWVLLQPTRAYYVAN